jgi:hypothetical protein
MLFNERALIVNFERSVFKVDERLEITPNRSSSQHELRPGGSVMALNLLSLSTTGCSKQNCLRQRAQVVVANQGDWLGTSR